MADIHQAVSYLNNELAKVAHLTLLRDALEMVQTAQADAAAAKKQVTEHETKLKGLKAALAKADVEHAKACILQEQALQAAQAAHEANLNKATDKAASEKASLVACIVTLEADYASRLAESTKLSKAIDEARHMKEDLESDVASLHKQLKDIKDSIR